MAALSRCSDSCYATQEDDVDPLDAFMDAAVNPEVAAAEKAEAARKEELRTQQVKALVVGATSRFEIMICFLAIMPRASP